MKLNKIFMALAATAIVGCTSDDLNDFSAKQAPEDSRMIELNSNFVLAGVGDQGAFTRTHWEQDAETKALVNKFLPIYNGSAVSGNTLNLSANLEAQAVGLCWLGQAPGAEVYTNYQFYHYGWLKKGETEAEVDNCDPFNLYNGVAYNEITLAADGNDGEEAVETNFTLPTAKTGWDLNYNSGVYKTNNKTIFGGKYIVYYPYDKEFQETGTIPAKAETSFKWDIKKYAPYTTLNPWEAPELGKATFRYSAPVDIKGGMNAANFGLFNLSTLVRLNVFTATAADAYNNSEIDKVILYSESEKLYKQANLGADKIDAGKQGQELYAGEPEGTKTITVNFTGTTLPKLNVKASTEVSAYITVLPTTVNDLVALVHATKSGESFWYRVELPATEFKAGNGQVINITVKEADITSDYVVVDQASLQAALVAANAAPASESNPQTITVIGDVKLGSNFSIDKTTYPNGKYITIDGGAIIVPQDVTLTIEALKEMKSDIRVLGKDCCTGNKGGRLEVNSTSTDPKDVITLNNVTLEKTEAKVLNETDFEKYNPMVTYQGTGAANIVIADGKKVNVIGGTVKVDRAVEHKGDIEIAKDGKLIVEKGTTPGDLNFLGSNIVNNGIIEVEKNAHFDITDEDGNASWADGQNMENNGKFIHQVDANVGTTVQNMKQNGEYRCKVDKQQALNDAYVKWTACSVIEMVKDGTASYDLGSACKHKDKYVDIEVNNGTTQTIFNGADDKNIEIGNLTVTATSKGLKINYAPNADKKQYELTVHGNMNVLYDSELTESKKVTVDGNLNVGSGEITTPTLTYKGDSKNKGGLEVKGDIIVTDATFDASDKDALEIKCKNFSLIKKDPAPAVIPEAKFGLRSKGNTKSTMTVGGTISNPKGCQFNMKAASGEDLLAWITCKKLTVGGAFPGGKPQVVE